MGKLLLSVVTAITCVGRLGFGRVSVTQGTSHTQNVNEISRMLQTRAHDVEQ
jgi:hypothetical protein